MREFFFVCRAKAQRRKEIGEDFSDLPELGKLGTFVYLALEDAKVQRKPLCGLAALRANFFFF
jgi:hypothetical protein